MKVLLDENLDHRLRKNLGQHEVFTVTYKGWAGLQNGELLRTAEADCIDVFLTGDQNLAYQQNLADRSIAVVALSSVEWSILNESLPAIVTAIDQAAPGSFQTVDCGTFSRKEEKTKHIEPEITVHDARPVSAEDYEHGTQAERDNKQRR